MRVSVSPRWLWLILLLAAVLRFVPLWFGLPYPHARPDEAVAVGHAMNVLEGRFNPEFFHWPSLTFYLFAAVFGIVSLAAPGERLDPAAALIVGRGVVALAGTITVYVLFAIARRVAGTPIALIAALFLAVAILHVRDSHFAMTDVLMTLLVTGSLALLLGAVDRASATAPGLTEPGAARFALAGLAGGLAASTKYSAGAIVAAMAASQIVLWMRLRTSPLRWRAWRPTLAFAAACAGGFLAGTPYAVLDYETFSKDLRFDFTHLSGGHGANLGRGWIYHATTSLPYGTGLVTFWAGIIGVPFMVRHYTRHAFVLGAFAVAFYAAVGSGYTVFFRYVMPLVPLVCLSAAVAVWHLGRWAADRAEISSRTAVALLAAIVTAPALVNCVWFDVLLARTDSRVLAGQWLTSRIQPGESFYDAGGDYASLDVARRNVHRWYFDPSSNSFGHPEGRTPDWLVLPQSPVRTYARVPAAIRRLATERYDLVHSVPGTGGTSGVAVYDLQDAFFLPFTGFHTVERPGPTIMIYRRKATATN